MARTDFVERWRGIASVDGLVETEDDLKGHCFRPVDQYEGRDGHRHS